MPLFKVTVIEKIIRKTVAYVDAPDANVADEWASNAPHCHFKQEDEEDIWEEVEQIDPIDHAPANTLVHKATNSQTTDDKPDEKI
jgi:hypothetical protein